MESTTVSKDSPLATWSGSTPTTASLFNSCKEYSNVLDLRFYHAEDIRSHLFYSQIEKYFIVIVIPILMTLGLIGNIGFLFVVAHAPGMRTTTNAFLANLAICDIIFIVQRWFHLFGVYIYSPLVQTDPYNSDAMCLFVFGLTHVSYFTSIALVVMMSVEKYYAICKPLKHRAINSGSRIRNHIIAAWIFGLVYSIPIVPHYGKLVTECVLWPDSEEFRNMPNTIQECDSMHPFFDAIPFILQAIPFSIATLITSVMYFAIIRKLHDRTSNNATSATDGDPEARRIRNQVARLLIVTGTVFLLCSLPYFVIGFNKALQELYELGFKMHNYEKVFLVARFLLAFNSVANPMIYSITNTRYRKAFIYVFCCTNIRRGNSSLDLTSSSSISISAKRQ